MALEKARIVTHYKLTTLIRLGIILCETSHFKSDSRYNV